MSPAQETPIENAVIMLAVSGSKIEREPAIRIGHQNKCYCPKHSFSFLGAAVLARIDKPLQYPFRSVAIAFAYTLHARRTNRLVKSGNIAGFGHQGAPTGVARASLYVRARKLLRIRCCEFLFQVGAPRRINSRVQSDQGLDFR
jgi:hypothetical protein